MRVVFMGTPGFAVPSLRALASRHEVTAVYTRPDAPAGRGRAMTPSPVAEAAQELGLAVAKPPSLRHARVAAELRALEPDVLAVVAYGLLLPPELLEVPRLAPVNVHASLLPRWRGAAPVQWAILAGDDITGVSVMRIEQGLDTGPWCLQRTVEVDEHTTSSLTARLAALGAEALLDALDELSSGTASWHAQDEAFATYARKVTPADVALAPSLTAEVAARRVRASSRQAPSRACVARTDVVVTEARAVAEDVAAGSVAVRKHALVLGATAGALEVLRLTPAGRGPMDGAAWARGARMGESATWAACA